MAQVSFPKSHDISKAIDKAAGAERNKVPASGCLHKNRNLNDDGWSKIGDDWATMDSPVPATPAAEKWDGYGTALKPAYEPICLAMNALDGTFAGNAVEHGVAGLNVDGGRVGTDTAGARASNADGIARRGLAFGMKEFAGNPAQGRWPANVIHDGSEEVLAGFPVTGASTSHKRGAGGGGDHIGQLSQRPDSVRGPTDTGTSARFFYCAKASKSERNQGCEGLEGGCFHPTVKPLALLRYLLTLVTMPERNLILDPFAGSGSTGVAAKELGLPCILIEKDERYCEIAAARVSAVKRMAQEVLGLSC